MLNSSSVFIYSRLYAPKGVANTKYTTATAAMEEVMIPSRLERIQPDKPILTRRLRNPIAYPNSNPAHRTWIIHVSTEIGSSGWSRIVNRQEETTAINRLHAAKADDDIIQLTDFFSEINNRCRVIEIFQPRKPLFLEATVTIFECSS